MIKKTVLILGLSLAIVFFYRFSCEAASSYTIGDLIGDWKIHSISSSSSGWEGWDRDNLAIDSDGNVYSTWTDSDQNSGTNSGKINIDSDGIITLSGNPSFEGIMSSDKSLIIVTSDYPESGDPCLEIGVKRTASSFSSSDLAGEWKLHSIYSSASGWEGWDRADITIDNNGYFTANSTDSDGSIESGSGKLAIDSNGIITSPDDSSLEGILSPLKNVLVMTAGFSGSDEPAFVIGVKQTAYSFNQSDLSGTWKIHSISSSHSGWEGWERDNLTIDQDGNLTTQWTASDRSSGNFDGKVSISSTGILTVTEEPSFEGILSLDKNLIVLTAENSPSDDPYLSIGIRQLNGNDAHDGTGYDVTADLWAKAVLKTAIGDVPLVWKMVGADITPSGAQVVSGYFYADPDDFAYGSLYNPEVFVKVYIDPNGWANLAFNHVTVDPVEVFTAYHFSGDADQSGTITLTDRLVEHQYTGVAIDSGLSSGGGGTTLPVAIDGGYVLGSSLWARAVLQVPGYPVTLVWKQVGTDTTPSGDRVVSGYFYADPADFAYGSTYNPEIFVKVYIAANGWANMALNHVTVDEVTVYSAHHYAGTPTKEESANLDGRLSEHQYDDVEIADAPDPVATFVITATAESNGSISPSGTITVDEGDDIDFTVIPDDGYQVADVTVNGSSLGPVGSYTFYDVSQDQIIHVTFIAGDQVPTFTVSASAGENGSISPSGTMTVYDGEMVAFSITPDDGYVIADVLVDGQSIGAEELYYMEDIRADQTIYASFAAAEGPVEEEIPDDDVDDDGDGYTENQGDLDDTDPTIYPGATEICGDGIDQDCDGSDLQCTNIAAGKIVYSTDSSGNRDIWVMGEDGNNRIQLTNSPNLESQPAWSPDGSMIAYLVETSSDQWELFVMDADGSNSTFIADSVHQGGRVRWSADGLYLFYSIKHSTCVTEIYRNTVDGNNEVLFMGSSDIPGKNEFRIGDIKSDRIVFQAQDGCSSPTYEIYACNLDGTDIQQLTSNGHVDDTPIWNDIGNKILYRRETGYQPPTYIHSMNPDGSDDTILLSSASYRLITHSSMSNDRILYSTNETGVHQFWIMNADGTNQTRLTNDSFGYWTADYLPPQNP